MTAAADAFTGPIDGPAVRCVAVTPSDSADLAYLSRSLYIGVAGDVKITDSIGNTVVFKAAPVGILPVRAARVWATATTATNIIALS